MKDRKAHWERVYATKSAAELSWYQQRPTRSLELIEQAGITATSVVIDVGGGDSSLVDALLDRGLRDLTVLDLSGAALARARERLGPRADAVSRRCVSADFPFSYRATAKGFRMEALRDRPALSAARTSRRHLRMKWQVYPPGFFRR